MHNRTHLLRAVAGLSAVLLILALAPVCQAAQAPVSAPGLKISAGPSPVATGGTVLLTLTYDLPKGAKIGNVPEVGGLEGFSIAGSEAGRGRIVYRIIADSLEPMKIGPLELSYLDSGGRKNTLRSGVLTVQVVSKLKSGADSGELKPIRDIIPVQSFWKKWGLPAGIVLLVLAAVAVIIYLLRRLKARGMHQALQDPPHIRAEKELEALLREKLFEQGLHKEFYFRFTEIIKRYLGDVRGFPAAEYTSEEIAQHIVEQDRPVLAVLKSADLVKFADAAAAQAMKDEDVSCFLAYINVTAPRTPEEEGGGNQAGGGI